MRVFAKWAMVLFLCGRMLSAQALAKAPRDAAAKRVAGLGRGVNLSGWYGGWGDYSAEHVAAYTTPADLQFIAASGLQYVRLCVDPIQFTTGGYDSPASVAALARLDASVQQILAARLNVLITVFPSSAYKKALLTPAGAQAYLELWKFMAGHFGGLDADGVFYDLLNEPELDDAARWNALQAQVAATIRTVDQQHTLIATGSKYAGIDELLQVSPLKDANVLYTFHFYEPFPFTHQGATWGSTAWTHLVNVPYPGAPEKLGPMIAGSVDPEARNMLAQYASEDWDDVTIRRRLAVARAWADKNKVTVICNEFGAFRDTIADEQRALYLRDVRVALEGLKIPWAEWDYRGNFGIVTRDEDGGIVPDLAVFKALGLVVPAPVP